MNKGISKWPSRALNLLVVLAMVISLTAILVAPPAAAQEWSEECDPSPVWADCHLAVAVSTYIKTEAGDFIAENSFQPGDCFYVNAVVVNNGNTSSVAQYPITATISFPDGIGNITLDGLYDAHCGDTSYSKTWYGNLSYTAPAGLMADFWWKVCCTHANGPTAIRVEATSAGNCSALEPACDTVIVDQSEPPENKCVEIEIVEAPGMADKDLVDPLVGYAVRGGNLGYYEMTMPGTVNPCTNFGIKAEVTNHCTTTLHDVYGIITLTGPGTLVGDGAGNKTHEWFLDELAPGVTKAVGWTVHCDGPGNVSVFVDARDENGSLDGITTFIDDAWIVHQKTPGGIVVDIYEPYCPPDCDGNLQTCKQPIACGAQNYIVKATVTNTGDTAVDSVFAAVAVEAPTPPAPPASNWATVTSASILSLGTLAPLETRYIQFNMQAKAVGLGNVTVTAYSAVDASLPPGVDRVAIHNMNATVKFSAAADAAARPTPDTVNQCQEFDVTFAYNNYTGYGWTSPAGGNITACIHWDRVSGNVTDSCGNTELRTGNATLIDSVWTRRIVSGSYLAWTLVTSSPVVTGNDTVGYTSCVEIPIICSCCGAEVAWRFRCQEVGEVQFYSTLSVQQVGPPAFTGSDISETICVDQVWKAHLMGDAFFFIQDGCGKMIRQEAVVPGSEFHVVLPVINTGDATAEDVSVYFIITDAPEGCAASYEVLSYSADITQLEILGGGHYIAHLGDIAGHTAKKAILRLRCLCEGQVTVWIPDAVPAWGNLKGIRGFDENTGVAVPQDNIMVPPCPRELEQVPFTIEIENPHTCDTFQVGATYPVKAKITNGSTQEMLDVHATIVDDLGNTTDGIWQYARLLQLAEPQTAEKHVGNISAGASAEITWVLQCTGANPNTGEGNVNISVFAVSGEPLLTAYSDDIPATTVLDPVIVHQHQPPTADLEITILSPGPLTYIATGQEFALTAKVENHGPVDAVDVVADIDPSYLSCDSLHYVTLAEGETAEKNLGAIDNGEFKVVTWTLWGGNDHDFAMRDCRMVNDTICVSVDSLVTPEDLDDLVNNHDSVTITVYPAAYLIASIDSITPSTSIKTCSEFVVNYRVTNYGVADAWEAGVTLSASPDGSVRIAEGEGGYDQYLGTIAGWTWGEPFNYVTGSFTLHCKQVCESTITITPWGDDECGWDIFGMGDYIEGVIPQLGPGREIPSKFLWSDSQTVKQLDNGQLDLAITKTVDNAFPASGQVVNFTVTVTNNGPTAASGVVVSDAQPAGLTFGAATASQGTFVGGVWTVGDLIVGGSATLVIPATVGSTGEITNTAEITAVDQPDPYAENDSASVTLNKPAVTQASITLKAGWNLISLPLIPDNGDITVLLSGVWGSFERALTYDRCVGASGTWYSYIKGGPAGFTVMADGKAYWVKMADGYAGGTVTFSGKEQLDPTAGVPKSYNVCVGWNMVGFKEVQAMSAGDYMGIVSYVRIWSFANGAYSPITSVDMMMPGLGYWVAVTAAGTIYP